MYFSNKMILDKCSEQVIVSVEKCLMDSMVHGDYLFLEDDRQALLWIVCRLCICYQTLYKMWLQSINFNSSCRQSFVWMKIFLLFLYLGRLLLWLLSLPQACPLMSLLLVRLLWIDMMMTLFSVDTAWVVSWYLTILLQLDFSLNILDLEERGWRFQQMRQQHKYSMCLLTSSISFLKRLLHFLVLQGKCFLFPP